MELAPMSFLGWLIIGALAGWLAGRIVEGYGFGLVGNIVIGILGACIGGLILPQLGIVPGSTGANFLAATLGAVILLVLIGLLQRR
ncbi:GlsB/YeaQ/YmgE family stress response membrane protein [Hyphomicrobium sp.]|uniref:GlsB/YeaQ/YmgE family stress response membrane protein n=1 Tax=Hyphomicrobium sp. TaxID=82 RepID=UPI0022BFD12F|nr:GlsB/YeaQ/YmgE family stress response membrane protein [Hyphomicrobium sp.]MCZ7594783.1 GlsB/YeaQ/YmgE family stress response membrane protein [Hyphomicrobium sp.]